MAQNPFSETNRSTASHDIPRILCYPEVPYPIHKCLPPDPVLSQTNLAHVPQSHFLKILFKIFSHLHMGLPSGHFPSRFTTKTLFAHLLSSVHATCPIHFNLLYLIA
jgi:hypothetical protein